MLRVWRLVTARFVATAFSGEGARRYGGRWNRKGVPVVYTAGNPSLAMLEMLVQDLPLRARYLAIPVEIPPGLAIERVDVDPPPVDWRAPAALEALRAIGSDWAAGLGSAVLAVPSAVVPAETNYLLNPRHPDFCQIVIDEAQALVTDLRLSQLRGCESIPAAVGRGLIHNLSGDRPGIDGRWTRRSPSTSARGSLGVRYYSPMDLLEGAARTRRRRVIEPPQAPEGCPDL